MCQVLVIGVCQEENWRDKKRLVESIAWFCFNKLHTIAFPSNSHNHIHTKGTHWIPFIYNNGCLYRVYGIQFWLLWFGCDCTCFLFLGCCGHCGCHLEFVDCECYSILYATTITYEFYHWNVLCLKQQPALVPSGIQDLTVENLSKERITTNYYCIEAKYLLRKLKASKISRRWIQQKVWQKCSPVMSKMVENS